MKQILILLFCWNTCSLFAQSVAEIKDKPIKIKSKEDHSRIKADGNLTLDAYTIYFSQNHALRYCDSLINADSLKHADYAIFQKYLLGYRKNIATKTSWIIEVAEKYDIKIRDLENEAWSTKTELRYYADGSIELFGYFGEAQKLIATLDAPERR